MRKFLIALTRDPVSLLGVAITTTTAVIILTLVATESVGARESPYIGILAYLILPAIFVVGLLLIPVGVFRARQRERRAVGRGEAAPGFPLIDLNVNRTRRALLLFLVLSAANMIILATATYKGVEVMDSTRFCADTCHVMEPERTAYARSPHARVKCVACHIGPGADWFVKAKLSGAWQVVATNLRLYPRPVPAPIHNLRPARDTCEQCHWPSKFVGDRLKVITHYADDDSNSEMETVLLLRVGGVEGRKSHGIHWHVDPGNVVRYRSDLTRETIYEVELQQADGTVRRYKSEGDPDAAGTATEWRTMDCVDCHNRPTHIYRMPGPEIDAAIQQGKIDRSLPYVRREGLRLLRQSHASHAEARQALAEGLAAYYRENHPEVAAASAASIDAAGRALGDLYAYNVFPQMNVDWGTYPNHLGHQDFPGCFRCHDDEHTAADGSSISQDCSTCHTLLAMEETDPEVLQMLQP